MKKILFILLFGFVFLFFGCFDKSTTPDQDENEVQEVQIDEIYTTESSDLFDNSIITVLSDAEENETDATKKNLLKQLRHLLEGQNEIFGNFYLGMLNRFNKFKLENGHYHREIGGFGSISNLIVDVEKENNVLHIIFTARDESNEDFKLEYWINNDTKRMRMILSFHLDEDGNCIDKDMQFEMVAGTDKIYMQYVFADKDNMPGVGINVEFDKISDTEKKLHYIAKKIHNLQFTDFFTLYENGKPVHWDSLYWTVDKCPDTFLWRLQIDKNDNTITGTFDGYNKDDGAYFKIDFSNQAG